MPVRPRGRSARAAVGLAALTSITLGAAPAAASDPAPDATHGGNPFEGDLARAYDATVKYKSEQAALDDGYIRTDECVFSDEGGMGYHYVKPAHVGSIDPAKPAALLYADDHKADENGHETGKPNGQETAKPNGQETAKPNGPENARMNGQDKGHEKGERKLVALEWVVPNTGQPRPQIFGRGFDDPEVIPGVGDVYTLHAWLFKKNPKGVFVPYNPRVKCSDEAKPTA
ncbi:hypothetical protein [Streptomyces sp. NPDC006551]|uniref:hypothetical protein n=1 Tax=Streptomyces sp. NPDC006551 TaxID=3157178 RepID=UPI0033BDDBD9